MKPLYIWAGGKNKMIPKYKESPSIPKDFDTFVEPFFGGGAMTIWVYKNCPNVKRFIINDNKPELISIYKAIKTDLDPFLKRMDDLSAQYLPLEKKDRKDFYYDLRKKYAVDHSTQGWSVTEEAATLYFLMKTAFNGIWQSTIEAKGRFCTPSGLLNHKDEVYDKDNVIEWHEFLQLADLYCGDWKPASDAATDKTFFFYDPPYLESFTQYGGSFDEKAHIALIDYCKKQDAAGNLVFYCNRNDDNDAFFAKHRGQLEYKLYDVTYTAGRRAKTEDGHEAKAAQEILLHSPSIKPVTSYIDDFCEENQ
jgi:DNA adenine methylase